LAKCTLGFNPHELAQKIESLSKGGYRDNIVFREYMRDVQESSENDYFENMEQNQSKADQITNREPEDKSLRKINRLTKYEDLPVCKVGKLGSWKQT